MRYTKFFIKNYRAIKDTLTISIKTQEIVETLPVME